MLLEARTVSHRYEARGGRRNDGAVALDDVTLGLQEAEILALVGESGSGKTTLGKGLAGLLKLNGIGGEILLEKERLALGTRALKRKLRRYVQIIFQDPFHSLNPLLSIGKAIAEPLLIQGVGKRERTERARLLLETVGLSSSMMDRRPRALSGGERQRVAIARALAPQPRILIADEPVASLDWSVRGQILDLLGRLRDERGVAILLITHDLLAVERIADRIAVMFAGRIVEIFPRDQFTFGGHHPYSRELFSATPRLRVAMSAGRVSMAEIPTILVEDTRLADAKGCLYAQRCARADLRCIGHRPPLRLLPSSGDKGVLVACHHPLTSPLHSGAPDK